MENPMYVWQQPCWPQFTYNAAAVLPMISKARKLQGELLERLADIDFDTALHSAEALAEADVIHTAAIEGEKLDKIGVRSSVAKHLGIEYAGLRLATRAVAGLVQVTLDAAKNYNEPLTVPRMCAWHAALFPTGRSGLSKITVGAFRNEHTEVVSGAFGKHKVHYEAPPPDRLEGEIRQFIKWWNQSKTNEDGLIRSAVAHFYFVTLHPFDDGNGKIARALADMALAQDEQIKTRCYSMSEQIMLRRASYYEILERTQKVDAILPNGLSGFWNAFAAPLKRLKRFSETL